VHSLPGLALIRVLSQILALCDVERVGGDDLVERVGGAGEELAGVAMAMQGTNVSNQSPTPPPMTSLLKKRWIWRIGKVRQAYVPQDMPLLVLAQLDRKFRVAAVAVAVVGCHDWLSFSQRSMIGCMKVVETTWSSAAGWVFI
jgi:hypothetical protein